MSTIHTICRKCSAMYQHENTPPFWHTWTCKKCGQINHSIEGNFKHENTISKFKDIYKKAYRVKRGFLGITKGMEFPVNKDGNIVLPLKTENLHINPNDFPEEFEFIEEPKYTDSDLILLSELIENSWEVRDATCSWAIQDGIKNFKIIKARNNS